MQSLAHGLACIVQPGRVRSIGCPIGDMPIDPHRSLRLRLREAHMRENKGRVRFQPTENFPNYLKRLLEGNMMEGKQPRGSVERTFGRDVDAAFVKTYPPAVLSGDLPCQLQHV